MDADVRGREVELMKTSPAAAAKVEIRNALSVQMAREQRRACSSWRVVQTERDALGRRIERVEIEHAHVDLRQLAAQPDGERLACELGQEQGDSPTGRVGDDAGR